MPDEPGCGAKYDPTGVDRVRLSRGLADDDEDEGRLTRRSIEVEEEEVVEECIDVEFLLACFLGGGC